MSDHRQRVILFKKQLTRVVDSDCAARVPVAHLTTSPHDQFHRLIPTRFLKPAVVTNEGPRQPLRAMIGYPSVQPFRPQPTVVDAVNGAPAHADDSSFAHSDVQRAAVRAEDAGRLYPTLRLFGRALVHTHRLHAVQVRRALAPDVVMLSWVSLIYSSHQVNL